MDVRDAVASRFSCRAFLPTPVAEATVREIIERAARAPSGGNLQAWRVYAIAGARLEALKAELALAGYTVDLAADGEEGLYAATEYPIDVAIIDLGLPKLSGLELIRQLRARGKSYGVLILTARDRWQDKVEGLQAGADDYVAKPFHFEEVLARLQALLRRAGGWSSPLFRCGAVLLVTRAQTVQVSGAPIELTTFEYRILEHLMLRAGEVVSKTELTERLYDQDFERDSNVIEVLIGRLRSITVTFIAAIAIGLLHDLLTPITALTNYRDITPFVLAAIALLVLSRRGVMSRSREEA